MKIEQILKHETAGDPISGLKWTHKTTRKITAELNNMGINVSKDTVAALLKELGFALRVNHKKISDGRYTSPEAKEKRNLQFDYIKQLKEEFSCQGAPCISVDAKKRELIGLFKNPGKTYGKQPVKVNDHDFRSLAEGIAIPYGIYDVQANKGLVSVGMAHDTPKFAVDSIVHWWESEGRRKYTCTKKILILADSGGSNSRRSRAWKYELFYKLGRRYGLEITVAHYPPGTSKWNPIEHRLFSEISKNWQGVPLRDYETVLKYIQTTNTTTGLKVNACLNNGEYEVGQKVTDKQMKKVVITKHETNPELNYTLNSGNVKHKHGHLRNDRKQKKQSKEHRKLIKLLEKSRRNMDSAKSMIDAVLSKM